MRPLSFVALAALAFVLGACESAPLTGRSQMMLVSASTERSMGLQAYQRILASERPSADAEVNDLVTKVGKRIAEAAEHPPGDQWKPPHFRWEFKTIEKNMVNAFCLPGGKVAVYTGLLAVTRNEAGLAAVLGHEVAHALARHGAERMSDQIVAQVGISAAAAVLASTAGGSNNTYAPLMMAAMGAGATYGYLLPMSRAHESEADHIGIVLMAMAGYDPNEAVGLWQRMRAANTGRRQAEWLSTHPADETRIANMRSWVPEAMKYYKPRD